MSISSKNASFIACSQSEWTINNIQLQRILYIASIKFAGNHEGKPLIDDEYFEAWQFGPVLPKIYQYCYQYGSGIIKSLPNDNVDSLSNTDEYLIILETVKELKDKPIHDLIEYTNDEIGAWYHARGVGKNMPILPEDFYCEHLLRKRNKKLSLY